MIDKKIILFISTLIFILTFTGTATAFENKSATVTVPLKDVLDVDTTTIDDITQNVTNSNSNLQKKNIVSSPSGADPQVQHSDGSWDPTHYNTIQEAIDAVTTLNGDTIWLEPSNPADQNTYYRSSGTKVIHVTKSLTFKVFPDPNYQYAIIDGQNSRRCVVIEKNLVVNFYDIHFINGIGVYRADLGTNGGSIYNMGNLTLTRTTFNKNKADNGDNGHNAVSGDGDPGSDGGNGGAIYSNGNLTIHESIFSQNSAGNGGNGGNGADCDEGGSRGGHGAKGGDGGDGGAIYFIGVLIIHDSKFIQNSAGQAGHGGHGGEGGSESVGDGHNGGHGGHGGHGGDGGAISGKGNLNIYSSEFSKNHSGDGGDGRYGNDGGAPGHGGDGGNGGEGGQGYGGGIGGAIHLTDNSSLSANLTIFSQNYTGKGGNGADGGDGADGGYDSSNGDGGDGGNGGNGGAGGSIGGVFNGSLSIISCMFWQNYTGQEGEGGEGGDGGESIWSSGSDGDDGHDGIAGYGGAIYNRYVLNEGILRANKFLANGSSQELYHESSTNTLDARWNFWYTNNNPSLKVKNAQIDPWLIFSMNVSPNPIKKEQSATVTADLWQDSSQGNPLAPIDHIFVDFGDFVNFYTNTFGQGHFSPKGNITMVNGAANTTYFADETLYDSVPIYSYLFAFNNTTSIKSSTKINFVIKLSPLLYITSTISNPHPKTGENLLIVLKLENQGAEIAKNVKIKITIPKGLELIKKLSSCWVQLSSCWAQNRTLIWDVGEVKVGEYYYFKLYLKAVKEGQYIIKPELTNKNYDLNLIQINIYVHSQNKKVNPFEVTGQSIRMQETGTSLSLMLLAILIIFCNLLVLKKK